MLVGILNLASRQKAEFYILHPKQLDMFKVCRKSQLFTTHALQVLLLLATNTTHLEIFRSP